MNLNDPQKNFVVYILYPLATSSMLELFRKREYQEEIKEGHIDP